MSDVCLMNVFKPLSVVNSDILLYFAILFIINIVLEADKRCTVLDEDTKPFAHRILIPAYCISF